MEEPLIFLGNTKEFGRYNLAAEWKAPGSLSLVLVLFMTSLCIVVALIRTRYRLSSPTPLVCLVAFALGIIVKKKHMEDDVLPFGPEQISYVYMLYTPLAVFAVAFEMQHHLFKQCQWQAVTLGILGTNMMAWGIVALQLLVLGNDKSQTSFTIPESKTYIAYIIAVQEPFNHSPFGFMFCGKQYIMETLLAGESLIGYCAMILSQRFLENKDPLDKYNPTITIIAHFIAAPMLGKIAGTLLGKILIVLSQHHTGMIMLSMCAVYITYLTAQMLLLGSGAAAVVGLALATRSASLSSVLDVRHLCKFWSWMRIIFGLFLMFIGTFNIARDAGLIYDMNLYRQIMVTYLGIFVLRMLMLLILHPILSKVGPPPSFRECIVMIVAQSTDVLAILRPLPIKASLVEVHQADMFRLCMVLFNHLINITILTKVMRLLGFQIMNNVERKHIMAIVSNIHKDAKTIARRNRCDKRFSQADWKWVEAHTLIRYPFISESEEIRILPFISIRVQTYDEERQIVLDLLRLQKISYHRQYLAGMIHISSRENILAQMQIPVEKGLLLSVDQIRSLITVPAWIIFLKSKVECMADEALREREKLKVHAIAFDANKSLITEALQQGWYHVLVGFISISFALILTGFLHFYHHNSSDILLSVIITVQGCYIFLYTIELAAMFSPGGIIGSKLSDWVKLDVALYFLIVTLFAVVSVITSNNVHREFAIYYQTSFLALVIVRAVKTIRHRVVIYVWMFDILDGILNRSLFYKYDLNAAIMIAEDDSLMKTMQTIKNHDLVRLVRLTCIDNRLKALTNLTHIKQQYPNIEAANKTRQAARRVMNQAEVALKELHEGCLISDTQFSELTDDLKWMVHDVDGVPTDTRLIEDPAVCVLFSVPWIPQEDALTLLDECYVYFKPGDLLIYKPQHHVYVSIILSGIVKVSGCPLENPQQEKGRLINTDSTKYFFSNGPFEEYITAPETLGVLGLLTGAPCVTNAVCQTAVELCPIPIKTVRELRDRFSEPPNLIYRIWMGVAVNIGYELLVANPQYHGWSRDKLRNFLESGVLPNLFYATEFHADDATVDLLLIQGEMICQKTGQIFAGPTIVAKTSKDFYVPQDPGTRPRPIVLITTNRRYHLPPSLDWFNQPVEDHDFPVPDDALLAEQLR